MKIGIILFAVTPLMQLGLGHMHAIEVIDRQPLKGAALEGLYETTKGAPLYAFGYVDEKSEKTYGLFVPGFLSFLYNFDFNSEIKGLKEFPREHWPPVNLVFQAYHVMVGVGILAIALGLTGVWLLWTGKLYTRKWFLGLLPFLIPLPHLAHETGWMAAEVGRQPWIIYGLMKTADSASVVVSSGDIMISLAMFSVVYTLLFVVFLLIFLKIIRHGPARAA